MHRRSAQRGRGLGVLILVLLLAGCGARAESAAPAASATPGDITAGRAAPPAQQVAHRRPPPPHPGTVLAEQIRAALRATRWPAGLSDAVPPGAPEWMRDKCLDVSARNAERCTYGPASAPRRVALMGDSVAVGWLPGLRRAPALRDSRISVLTRRQCPNVRGVVPAGCAAHQDWALGEVRRLRPDLVVLSARYQGGQTPEQWQAGTRRAVAALAPYAGRIVVLAPPPDTSDVRECRRHGIAPGRCGRTVSTDWLRFAYAEQQGSRGPAAFVDPRPWFCLDGRCPALIDGLPVTFDGRHLSAAYAGTLAAVLSLALG